MTTLVNIDQSWNFAQRRIQPGMLLNAGELEGGTSPQICYCTEMLKMQWIYIDRKWGSAAYMYRLHALEKAHLLKNFSYGKLKLSNVTIILSQVGLLSYFVKKDFVTSFLIAILVSLWVKTCGNPLLLTVSDVLNRLNLWQNSSFNYLVHYRVAQNKPDYSTF